MKNEYVKFNGPNRPARISTHIYDINYSVDLHFHSELELMSVISGMVRYRADGNEYIIKEGDVIFFNSSVPHSTETLADNTYIHLIQFSNPSSASGTLHYLSSFLKNTGVPVYIFNADDPDNSEINGYITQLVRESKKKETAYDYYIIANLYMITALLHRKKLLSDIEQLIDRNSIAKILPALEYINENYNENISLQNLSNLVNFNEYYFCRVFKKATCMTAIEYINFVKSYNAVKLLKTNLSISEISNQLGFSSISYFNRTFKKFYRCSPSTYRKLIGHGDMANN